MERALKDAHYEFSAECHARLEQQHIKGFKGWDKMQEVELRVLLRKNFDREVPDYIDVANLAMMLHTRFGGMRS
jgi:hypothetical protein